MALEKRYNFSQLEEKWRVRWIDIDIYKWEDGIVNNFVIDTPPPTISGMNLHMGHFFSYVHTDCIARFQRMMGKNVFYPMGFDDNGLPTERLVESILRKNNKNKEIDRSNFGKECAKVSLDAQNIFRNFFNAIGLSVDWSLKYNTASSDCIKISQMSFLDLYQKKLLYSKYSPGYWDCIDKTAISQAEIIDKQLSSVMYYIEFFAYDTNDNFISNIVIATTRPELMPACIAVLINVKDERYAHLNLSNYNKKNGELVYRDYQILFNDKPCGVYVKTALGIKVPLLFSDDVIIEKGSGAVMLCTFGDEQDLKWVSEKYSWGINNESFTFTIYPQIINFEGKIVDEKVNVMVDNNIINGLFWSGIKKSLIDFVGMNVKDARKKIIESLYENIIKQENIFHIVKCAERSGAPLEILLSKQWYIKILGMDIFNKNICGKWHPGFMLKRLEQWVDGLRFDWCISRQRYYGACIPVWYIKINNNYFPIIAKKEQLPVNPLVDIPDGFSRCNSGRKLNVKNFSTNEICIEVVATQDHFFNNELLVGKDQKVNIYPDLSVMDTWATSALSPNINAGYINKDFNLGDKSRAHLLPADLRPQAHEIIRTWAFYTIVKSFMHNDSMPWRNVMISGWCLAKDKTKMSKSKGNVLSPEDLLKKYGADPVRYWAFNACLGTDTVFSEDIVLIGKKLVNKLWNAAKFVELHIFDYDGSGNIAEDIKNNYIVRDVDVWILIKLLDIINNATKSLEDFDYYSACKIIEKYFWNCFCDNYLELVKSRLYNNIYKKSVVAALYHCFKSLLVLFAPFMPFVTEEIYSNLFVKNNKSVHSKNNWPNFKDYKILNNNAKNIGEACVSILEVVRKIKSDLGISIKKICTIKLILFSDSAIDVSFNEELKSVLNAEKIDICSKNEFNESNFIFTKDKNYAVSVFM